MASDFRAETFQNEFLPAGEGEVHAIMTVTAGEGTASSSHGERLFGILCDVSGSMEGGKIVAAKAAMAKLVELLPPDCNFFIVTGSDGAHLVVPSTRADSGQTSSARWPRFTAFARVAVRGSPAGCALRWTSSA